MRQRLEALERQSAKMPKLPVFDALLKDVFALQGELIGAIENLREVGRLLNEQLLHLKIEIEALQEDSHSPADVSTALDGIEKRLTSLERAS